MIKYIFEMVSIASIVLSFIACSNNSTSPNNDDISSSSNTSVSSSSVNVSSSSKTPVSSSSIKNSSSSNTSVSSSSAKVPSSSNASISSSSSVESTPYSYPEWNTCVSEGRCGTFTDSRETPTKEYRWVKIGTQTWMAENLAYLPSVSAISNKSNFSDKYYVYDYDGTVVAEAKASSNYTKYGVLYNWTAAKVACPTGWHLPDTTEWNTLETYVSKDSAGVKLKATSGWSTSNISGTDSYGFSALPAGHYGSSNYTGLLGYTSWWTATKDNFGDPYNREINYLKPSIDKGSSYSYSGLSVRCVSTLI